MRDATSVFCTSPPPFYSYCHPYELILALHLSAIFQSIQKNSCNTPPNYRSCLLYERGIIYTLCFEVATSRALLLTSLKFTNAFATTPFFNLVIHHSTSTYLSPLISLRLVICLVACIHQFYSAKLLFNKF